MAASAEAMRLPPPSAEKACRDGVNGPQEQTTPAAPSLLTRQDPAAPHYSEFANLTLELEDCQTRADRPMFIVKQPSSHQPKAKCVAELGCEPTSVTQTGPVMFYQRQRTGRRANRPEPGTWVGCSESREAPGAAEEKRCRSLTGLSHTDPVRPLSLLIGNLVGPGGSIGDRIAVVLDRGLAPGRRASSSSASGFYLAPAMILRTDTCPALHCPHIVNWLISNVSDPPHLPTLQGPWPRRGIAAADGAHPSRLTKPFLCAGAVLFGTSFDSNRAPTVYLPRHVTLLWTWQATSMKVTVPDLPHSHPLSYPEHHTHTHMNEHVHALSSSIQSLELNLQRPILSKWRSTSPWGYGTRIVPFG
ncbi:hypothetical protein LIA77_03732 [Sarocladium implicatum]|nr:hypothetical protein LIA77_03732 [Sarocladium implicatum]